ncbi:hypothetical protein [Romboutsia sp.]|uniref:hypothetical protein n=1 Tax=Romboutsia sp. TaxID=1965302 RepID=UPI002C036B59|nr:hypothetical protein [Romboutsia sp.]HSQ90167.1 hypothetical protein [Romboutsia sp.]
MGRKKKNKHIKEIKKREKEILSNEKYEKWVDELMDTHPNYMALLHAILHNKTPDKALHHVGVRALEKTPRQHEIENNSYVSNKRRGKGIDRDRVINV